MTELEIRILKCLLEQKHSAVNGDTLAEYCGVSQNKVRSEITGLNERLKSEGITILAKPSVGYQLCVEQGAKADSFFEELKQQIYNPLFGRNTQQEYNVNYLIRRLLSTERYISLQQLCQELYYSESAVKKDLMIVSVRLADFHLSLKNKSGWGYRAEGNEWMKRLCLCAQDKLHVNLPKEQQQRETAYRRMMGKDQPVYRPMMELLRQGLRNNRKISCKLIEFPILVNYLPLMLTRRKETGNLSFTEQQRKALERSGLTETARELLAPFQRELPLPAEEVEGYAFLLLLFRTVTAPSQLRPEELDRLLESMNEISGWLDQRVTLTLFSKQSDRDASLLSTVTEEQRDFLCCWYGIENRVLFHIPPDEENDRPLPAGDFVTEDLCIQLAKYLEKKHRTPVDIRYTRPLSYLLCRLLQRREKDAFRYRGLVVSTYGYQYARHAAALIRQQYGWYFETVAAAEYTELNQSLADQYDLIFTDMRPDMRPALGNARLLWLELMEEGVGELRELREYLAELEQNAKMLVTVRQMDGVLTWDEVWDFVTKDLEGSFVSQEQGGPKEPPGNPDNIREKLALCLQERPRYRKRNSVYQNTLYLTCWSLKGGNWIRAYDCAGKLRWKRRCVRRIVCYSYEGNNMRQLYLMRRALRETAV